MAETQEFKYHVAMSCGGCSGAINRVLTKAKGAFYSIHSTSTSRLQSNHLPPSFPLLLLSANRLSSFPT